MIDYGISPKYVKQYLAATRGNFTLHTSSVLPTFFLNSVTRLESLGFDASHVRLSLIDSHVGDVETLHIDGLCHIIYDSGLFNLHYSIVDALFESIAPPLSHRVQHGIPAWVHAVYAARYLSGGQKDKSAFNAHHALVKRIGQPTNPTDPNLIRRWATVMSAYSIAHELAHCTIRNSSMVIARKYAESYERSLLPIVRYLDSVEPPDLIGEGRGRAHGPLPVRSPSSVYESPLKLNEGELRELQQIFETHVVPVYGRKLTLEERLDSIMSSLEGTGEEVICDAIAIELTTANLGEQLLPLDETLMACHMASRANELIRDVDLALKPAGSSDSLDAPIPYEYKVATVMDIWETFTSSWMRSKFSAIYTSAIYRSYNQSNPLNEEVSKPEPGDNESGDGPTYNPMELHLSRTLNSLQQAFDQHILNGSGSRCALQTDCWHIGGGADSTEFREYVENASLHDDIRNLLVD